MWNAITSLPILSCALAGADDRLLPFGPETATEKMMVITPHADTMIRADERHQNYGTNGICAFGSKGAKMESIVLIRWDMTGSKMRDVIVRRAILTLPIEIVECQGTGCTLRVRVVASEWDEMSATWTHRSKALLWRETGGDYEAPALITKTLPDGFVGTIVLPVPVALVGKWMNKPKENHGIALDIKGCADGTASCEIRLKENSVARIQPRIVLVVGPSTNTCLELRN